METTIPMFDDYQELAQRTEKLPGTPAGDLPEGVAYRLMHHTFGVTGEAGEIADAVKRVIIYGKPLDRDNIIEEVGDVMWYLAGLANALNFTLADAAGKNIAKLKLRYPEKYTDRDALARADKVEHHPV